MQPSVALAAITFGLAIVAGGAQYVGTIILEQVLSKQLFSQVTVILGYLASYMLLVELGIQEELIKRQRDGDQAVGRAVLRLRLWGAAVGFALLLTNSWLTRVSIEVFWGTVAFGLCLFPAALLLTCEADGYRQRKPILAAGLRLARAMAMLLVAVLLLVWRPEALSAGQFAAIFAVFPVIFAWTAWWMRGRLVRNSPGDATHYTGQLVRESWDLIVARLLNWCLWASFYHFCIGYAGDENLSELTMALVLTVPVSILMQVYAQVHFAHEQSAGHGGLQLGLLVLIGAATYGGALSVPMVHAWLFSKLDHGQLMHFFWPFLAAVVFGGASIIIVVTAQGLARRWAAIASPALGLACLWGYISQVPAFIPFGYAAWGWMLAAFLGMVTAWAMTRLICGD